MPRRFVSIWFPRLSTDWFAIRQPHLHHVPFVLSAPLNGRMIVTAANGPAVTQGIDTGMPLADARAIIPSLQVIDDKPDLVTKLLKRIAEWCIRFTPIAAVDEPNGIILDGSGCAHLWGGEQKYLDDIAERLKAKGYYVRVAIADTIGAAWAVARFSKELLIIQPNAHVEALLPLPPAALRLEQGTIDRLRKLGLRRIQQFIAMPRPALRRRFGAPFLNQLDRALGYEREVLTPFEAIKDYQERLPCMDPVVTATGIGIALERLLQTLCKRLRDDQKGLRHVILKCYRVDGKIEQIAIATNKPSHSVNHLFKLFEDKIQGIEPALGIELFVLEATKVEDHRAVQEKMWQSGDGLEDVRLSELIDRLTGKDGVQATRYLPAEHYWPERSLKPAASLHEKLTSCWMVVTLRPMQLLADPEKIEVTAPIPDYPPMLFRHRGKLHRITKADGPERIEQEWWLQQGEHRDYYRVEDDTGNRYWLFRLGHYNDKSYQWYMHGFFA
ncbi:MAG: DNA polymerase Y family protein [Chryseolinea sp.]